MREPARRRIRIIASLISFLICIFLMGLAFYIAYERTYNQAVRNLQTIAEKTRLKYEVLVNPLEATLDSMTKIGKQCTQDDQRQLQVITINDPNISLAFVEKNNQLCSNIGKLTRHIPSNGPDNQLMLSGPLSFPSFKDPAFILSQSHKGFQYGVVLNQPILKKLLPSEFNDYMFSALGRLPNRKVYFYNGAYSKPNALNANIHSVHLDDHYQDEINRLHIILKLPLFKNVYLFSALSTEWIWDQLKLHIFTIFAIGLILCAIALYLVYLFTQRKLSLRSEMEIALKHDEFFPYYQPVIDLKNNSITGVECLIRWKPKNEPMVFPDTFMPTADRTGLIKPMTILLIKQIFSDLGDYLSTHTSFHVAINLTPQHFEDENILTLTLELCNTYHVKPEQIIFELTEQELLKEENDEAVDIMKKMRNKGFSLALDDFGTGYSSMNYLQRFPFDFLKIDRQFVIAIGSGAVTEGLADSIISLAKRLSLKIIAEGIELQSHADYLREQDVEYAQGWLFSKALSIETLFIFMENKANKSG